MFEDAKIPPSISDYQRLVAAWVDHNFGVPTVDDRVLNVSATAEEAGELLKAVRKQAQRIRGTWIEWDEEIRKEAGDTFIALCQAAYTCGFDLAQAVADRWKTVRQRDFKANPVGHGLPKDDHPAHWVYSGSTDPKLCYCSIGFDHNVDGSIRSYDYETEGLGGT